MAPGVGAFGFGSPLRFSPVHMRAGACFSKSDTTDAAAPRIPSRKRLTRCKQKTPHAQWLTTAAPPCSHS
eukprot:2160-Pyramimonas_sp.AAC.1